jgi:uncharacterized protein YndB with AHSA1/START domain
MTDTATPRTLSITRHINAPRDIVWRCWTQNDLLQQWYCPKPWRVSEADLDVRVGGRSAITMAGPNGEIMPHVGQYLEVIDQVSLTFSDAFVGNWVPSDAAPFMVGFVTLTDNPAGGTNMVWGARHWSDAATQQHKDMGFETGWNAAADQLDALAQSLASGA